MYRGMMVEYVRWAKRGRMPGFFCRRDAIWCLMKCRFLRVGAGARVSRPAPPPRPPPASRRAARSLPPRRSPPSARSDREPGAARELGGCGAAAPVPGLPRPRSLEPRPLARLSPGQRRGRAGNRLAPYKPGAGQRRRLHPHVVAAHHLERHRRRQEEMRARRAALRVFGPRRLQAAVVFGQILLRNDGIAALAFGNPPACRLPRIFHVGEITQPLR